MKILKPNPNILDLLWEWALQVILIQLNPKTPGVMGGKKAPVPTPFSLLRHVPALVGSTSTGWSMPQTHFLRPKRKMPKDEQ